MGAHLIRTHGGATTDPCAPAGDRSSVARPNPGSVMSLRLLALLVLTALPAAASAAEPELDYDFYKARVEPIFLAKRAGHARCYVCHAESSNAFRLERLPAGRATWTEDQSRHNFATVSTLVVPGDPAESRLLLQPLAPEGGGNAFHSGGRQFASKDDPDWKVLVDWVNGAKATPK
jgi:hypothetical protein